MGRDLVGERCRGRDAALQAARALFEGEAGKPPPEDLVAVLGAKPERLAEIPRLLTRPKPGEAIPGWDGAANAPITDPMIGTGTPTIAPTRPPASAPHPARREAP